MLQVDPTEAIHSELIVETLHRYFHVERFVALGGAIAYPILTHNERLFACQDKAEQAAVVERVLQADEEFLAEHPDSTLFAYVVATPNKDVLGRTGVLAEWEQEENDREERARANGGTYYPNTALQDAYDRLITESVVSAQLRAQVADLEGQLDAIRQRPGRLETHRAAGLTAGRAASATPPSGASLRSAPQVGTCCAGRCLECPHVPDRPAHTPGPRGGPPAPPHGPPGLTSPRVKRNRRFWGAGLLVALALVLALVLSRGGGGQPTTAGQSHSGGGRAPRRAGAEGGQPPARSGLEGQRAGRHVRLRGRRPLPGRHHAGGPAGG